MVSFNTEPDPVRPKPAHVAHSMTDQQRPDWLDAGRSHVVRSDRQSRPPKRQLAHAGRGARPWPTARL